MSQSVPSGLIEHTKVIFTDPADCITADKDLDGLFTQFNLKVRFFQSKKFKNHFRFLLSNVYNFVDNLFTYQ